MEKKWNTVIPADLIGLFVKWDIYVPLVRKRLIFSPLTLSNPIFLPTTYSPALILFWAGKRLVDYL
jgi:hypothetical protein